MLCVSSVFVSCFIRFYYYPFQNTATAGFRCFGTGWNSSPSFLSFVLENNCVDHKMSPQSLPTAVVTFQFQRTISLRHLKSPAEQTCLKGFRPSWFTLHTSLILILFHIDDQFLKSKTVKYLIPINPNQAFIGDYLSVFVLFCTDT